MTKELGLGGAKLLVYALIYSFTVNDGSFFGSRGYICEACGINSLRTVDRVLRELTNEGLLMRLDKVGADCVTYATVEIKDIGKKCMGKNSTPPEQKMPIPPAKIAHNNKDYNKTNIHTNKHANSVCANAKEDTEEVDRFAEGNTKEGNKNEGENSFHRKRSPSPKEEASDRRRMSPSLEDGGCEVRIIHEGKNKDKEVEKLKREIDAGTFHGDIKVPGDIFLEDELIQRKHGLIDAKRNKDDDLRCVFSRFGYQQMVQMTDAQYDYLARTYGEDTVEEYIQRLEHTILTKPGFRAYSHYKTIIRWLKEDMQCADAFAPV